MTDYTGVINTAINALPGILALIRANHAQQNPNDPPLTDADVLKALDDAVSKTIAIDEAWKTSHPVTNGSTGE